VGCLSLLVNEEGAKITGQSLLTLNNTYASLLCGYLQVVVAVIISFILEAFLFRIRNKTHTQAQAQDENSK